MSSVSMADMVILIGSSVLVSMCQDVSDSSQRKNNSREVGLDMGVAWGIAKCYHILACNGIDSLVGLVATGCVF